MKKFITILLIAISFTASSQTSDAVLNKRLAEYLVFSKELKVDALLDYMYPRMFELASREQLKQLLEQAFNSPDISIKLDSLTIDKILPVSKFSKGAYTKFTYSLVMKIKLTNPAMEDKSEAILDNFKEKFGEKNVFYDETTKLFSVYQTKDALAIKDNYSKNIWTMLGLEKEQSLEKIIPAEIKAKYKLK